MRASCYIYENEEEKLLNYYQYDISIQAVVTSDGKTVEEIMVEDHVATRTADEVGRNVIFYNDKNWTFMVTGQEDVEEMVKILESIN